MGQIVIGGKFELEELVTEEMSAARAGSGALDVFATPFMIALMEKTAMTSMANLLDDGETTVGGAVNIMHYKPTAIGRTVRCTSEISGVKGKKVDFEVKVFEGTKLIGEGSHTRFIVNEKSFMENL